MKFCFVYPSNLASTLLSSSIITEVGRSLTFNLFLISGSLSISIISTSNFSTTDGLSFTNFFNLTQAGHQSAPSIIKSFAKQVLQDKKKVRIISNDQMVVSDCHVSGKILSITKTITTIN